MMSAKTVLTETCPTPSAPATNATAPATPGGAPSEFQSALAGATIDLSFVDTLPTIPIAQLLGAKPQTPRQAPVTLGANGALTEAPVSGAPVTEPAAAKPTPSDLLQLLTDSATLLPESAKSAEGETLEVHVEPGDELKEKPDEDVLAEWMETMIPQGVFAPQAGSQPAGENGSQGERREGGGFASSAAATLTASLSPQAGLPDATAMKAAADAAAAATAGASTTVASAVASAVANATSNVVQMTGTAAQAASAILSDARKTETADARDSRDGWMNTLNQVVATRGHEVAATDGPRLSTPVHDSRWADALAHRLVMMARDGESVAQLKLVPQDLGPLDIQISVRDGEANVHFGAAHPETRAALESSMPRLRELLSSQGLQLANASVSHQSAGQQAPQRTAPPSSPGAVEEPEAVETRAVSTSLLDLYA